MALIDTNVLVYRFDPRFPRKQRIATELLRAGLANRTARLPHQALVEFVAATTRTRGDRHSAADTARGGHDLRDELESAPQGRDDPDPA